MPQGQQGTKANRQPVCIDDDAIFTSVYIGGTAAPLVVYSGSVVASLLASSVLSQSSQLSVIKSTADSG